MFMLRRAAGVRFTCRVAGIEPLEDASLRMLVEVDVRPCGVVGDAKQKITATLKPTVSKVINGVHGTHRE